MATKTKSRPVKTPKITPSADERGRSKSDTFNTIAATTGLTRKQVVGVFDSLAEIIKLDLGKRGPGVFKFMGLMKLTTVAKPATKSRMGRNPFTGEPQLFKAKPASRKVRVRALKTLNEMI